MKKLLFGVVACALAAAAFAAPTATYVKTIDISSVSNFPTGLDFYNGSLYFVTFNNRRLIRVDGPLTASPTPTIMHDFSSDITWLTGRGMIGCNVNPANGDIYTNGENGSGATGVIGVFTNAGAQSYLCTNAAGRYTAMDRYGTTSTVFAALYLTSSVLREIDISTNPPTELAQSVAAAAPYNSNFRDCKVVGERVYYSRNGTTADGYARFDTVNANTLAGALATGIYQTTGTNTVSAMGIGYFADGPTQYVLVPDVSGKAVRFVNVATGTVDLSVDHAVFSTGGLRDAVVGTISGTQYLFVTHAGAAPPAGDAIEVFQLGTAEVRGWEMY